MSKHTPGPWEISEWSGMCGKGNVSIIGADDRKIGKLNSLRHTALEDDANAKLVAAAPELLEACEWMLEVLDAIHEDYWGVIDDSVFAGIEDSSNVAREAIAKAKEGED